MPGVESPPVALVTGGSRGIGRGIVRELARAGFSIAIHYRSAVQEAEASREEALNLGAPNAEIFSAEIGDLEQIDSLVARIHDRFGTIDLLVNNAGVAPSERRDVLETSIESWDRVLGINLRGPFYLSQKIARGMVEATNTHPERTTRIVFVTSVSAEFASTNRVEYCVAKAGLSMVARVFAVGLASKGVEVVEVRPGVIETDMTGPVRAIYDRRIEAGEISLTRRWGTPEDVGRAVAAIARGDLPFATGQILQIDGGLHVPRL